MLDIEAAVFEKVCTALNAAMPAVSVSSAYLDEVESFPAVYFAEISNTVSMNTRTLDRIENHANLAYEAQIYTAAQTGQKAEARAIAAVVDSTMEAMGFTRTYFNPVPNRDRGVYRLVIRWEGKVSVEDIAGITTRKLVYAKE